MAEKQSSDSKKKVEDEVKNTETPTADETENEQQQAKQGVKKEDNETKEQKQIEELVAKSSDFEDKYLRAEAEIQNMTNRFKKEQSQLLKYDGQSLAKDILPVMDNLKRALDIEVDDESGQQLKKGIQMVHDHLEEALTKNGVTEIKSLDQKFDPAIHQAVQSVPAKEDQKADTVVQVLQAGYQLKDRVLRPAMVVVAQ